MDPRSRDLERRVLERGWPHVYWVGVGARMFTRRKFSYKVIYFVVEFLGDSQALGDGSGTVARTILR